MLNKRSQGLNLQVGCSPECSLKIQGAYCHGCSAAAVISPKLPEQCLGHGMHHVPTLPCRQIAHRQALDGAESAEWSQCLAPQCLISYPKTPSP